MEHRLTVVEDRSKSNQHRIEDIEKRQDKLDDLVSTVKVLADQEKRVEEDVKEIKSDVKALNEKPAKKWDGLIDKIILTIAAAGIGFLLSKIGI